MTCESLDLWDGKDLLCSNTMVSGIKKIFSFIETVSSVVTTVVSAMEIIFSD
jgi:hypothetical protein